MSPVQTQLRTGGIALSAAALQRVPPAPGRACRQMEGAMPMAVRHDDLQWRIRDDAPGAAGACLPGGAALPDALLPAAYSNDEYIINVIIYYYL